MFDDILRNHVAYRTHVSFRYYFYDKVVSGYEGYSKLIQIFDLLENGNENCELPMFAGGIFSPKKIRYLNNSKLLSKDELREILVKLLFFNEENALVGKFVNYAQLDTRIFGEIYEDLLQYDLRIAEYTLHHVFENGAYCVKKVS